MAGLKIQLKNIKAINNADIELADITVLAGVNASGKSTIAKYVHALLVANHKFDEFSNLFALHESGFDVLLPPLVDILTVFRRNKSCEKAIKSFVAIFKEMGMLRPESVSVMIADMKSALRDEMVSKRIAEDARILSNLNRVLKKEFKTFDDLLNFFEMKEGDYKRSLKKIKDPSYKFPYYSLCLDLLAAEGRKVFVDKEASVKITDDGVMICDSKASVDVRHPLYSPYRSIYIADPSSSRPKRDGDWVEIGKTSYRIAKDNEISLISREKQWKSILAKTWAGHFEESKASNAHDEGWVFVQKGVDHPIRFAECAEGIKSLSGLDFIDKLNLLDSGTLLIVDEPEVHLHPQWIVEYARMIISMVKEQHVRVLLTTHSPYLVRALRNLSVGELDEGQLCFYVAEKTGRQERFDYRKLGTNIAPIFKIFNVALEEIAYVQE